MRKAENDCNRVPPPAGLLRWLVGRKPTMTIVFAILAYAVGSQMFLHFIHSSRSDDAAGQGEDGRSGKPWRKPIYAGGRRNFAPAVVFQNARFRGRSMPIVGNISDMTKEGFRDVSSMKVSKGVTVILYSKPGWTGRELLIDADATFIGMDMNDRVYSVSMIDQEPAPHAVKVYRVGSSMNVDEDSCPGSIMCWPATTLPRVERSVYMGNSRILLDEVGRRIGCQVNKFLSVEGRRLYGVLPEKVFVMCVGEEWVLPAEMSGHVLEVSVASLGRRVALESASLVPRVYTARSLFSEEECAALIAAAVNISATGADGGVYYVGPSETPMVKDAVERAAELVHVPSELATDVVFRRYKAGEELGAHVDAVDPKKDKKYVGSNSRNRFVTVLVYLSALGPGDGGETIFTRGKGGDAGDGCGTGLRVSPGKGGAVVFYSLLADGQQQGIIDRFSHHGACKLRSREKWVASIMFNNKLSRLQELAKEQREREANTRGKHTETR